MANASCSLTCNVKDPRTGKIEVSSLWEDLSKFFKGDRRQAVTHYFLTKDNNFLRENSDILEFNVDGEVTISSLKKALERDGEYSNLSNARTREHLNRELKAGKYDYSEALDNVLRFNKSSQFNDNWMATLKKENDGKYSIEVVERTPDAEYTLADHVQNKILTDAIRLILKDKGLSVEFLDNPSYAVQYNTQNIQLDAEGLMSVAQVLNGVNTAPEVAEVAGHFIVASMQDSPLVQRLINLLDTDVQRALFRNEKSELNRDDFIVADTSAKEAAGILLGRALLEPIEKAKKGNWYSPANLGPVIPRAIKWLLTKIVNLAQRVLGTYTPDEVGKLIAKAKSAASTAAMGFINNPEEADVEAALAAPSTYRSGSLSKRMADNVKRNIVAYYDTLGGLKDVVSRLRESIGRSESPTNQDIMKKLKTLVRGVSANYESQMKFETLARAASIEGIVVTLEGLTQILDTDVRTLLEQIQPSNKVSAFPQLVSNARNLRTVNTAIKNIAQIYETIQGRIDSLSAEEVVTYRDADDNMVIETLREAVKRLGDVLVGNNETFIDRQGQESTVNGLQGLLESKRRQIFIDALRDFYGQDTINKFAGVVWQQNGWMPKLVKTERREKEVRDFADSLEEDISWFDRYLESAADCGDFVTAVGNKQVKQANMSADRLAFMFWDRLETSRLQMEELFGNSDWTPLLEVVEVTDDDGKILGKVKSGNFVSQLNYGAWENARKEFKESLKQSWNEHLANLREAYYKNNKGGAFNLTDQQRAVLYHNFVDPLWKKWHVEHSEKVKTTFGEKWVPNSSKYKSKQWEELFGVKNPSLTEEEISLRQKRLKWYNSFMEIKKNMDELLPTNATVPWRAPQMTGRFSHRYKNLNAKMNNSRAAFGNALRRSMQDWAVIRPDEAWMFGSNNEFNELNEDPLEDEMYFQREKINRLPVFGINKLKNMEDLSTDIFGTMMQYGSMAATYHAMSQLVDVFELGKDVLKQRRLDEKGKKSEKNLDEGQTKAYARYLKFLEKQVYGINVTPPNWDRKNVWRKFANNLSSLGGRILLWGNVHGGIVNTGTGMFEIMKEAAAGENFNMAEVAEAHKMYYSGLLDSDGYFGTFTNMFTDPQRADDKNSLWIRHWNILSENRSFLYNQRFDNKAMSLLDNRMWEWFNHTMMLPYSSGDHYMQTIPYYAMGIRTKVYDHEGNRMRLIDAYEIVDGEEVFAVEREDGERGRTLGRTPKKLKLKDGIFKTPADIDKFDTVQGLLGRINNFYQNNPNIKDNAAIALDMFSDSEKEFLHDEELDVPINVKQLSSLKNALELKASKLRFNEEDESAFMDKCRNICNRLHGIYNSEDKVCLQQNFYGNLVMAMRGYALGMINRRFAPSRFNVPQGKVVEGSYQTLFKVFMSSLFNMSNADNWKAVGEAMFLMMPIGNLMLGSSKYGERLKADMLKAGFSEHQYYNMRRNSADFLVLEALALMNLLASPGAHFGLGDKDEDKNNKVDTSDNFLAGLIYYFTMRWFNEQGAFTWPTAIFNEGTQLLDYVPVGASGFFALMNLGILMARTGIDGMSGERDFKNSDLYYQSSKKGKYSKGEAKWHKKFKSLAPYYRSYYALSHPYDAATSYEYGRRVRGK